MVENGQNIEISTKDKCKEEASENFLDSQLDIIKDDGSDDIFYLYLLLGKTLLTLSMSTKAARTTASATLILLNIYITKENSPLTKLYEQNEERICHISEYPVLNWGQLRQCFF